MQQILNISHLFFQMSFPISSDLRHYSEILKKGDRQVIKDYKRYYGAERSSATYELFARCLRPDHGEVRFPSFNTIIECFRRDGCGQYRCFPKERLISHPTSALFVLWVLVRVLDDLDMEVRSQIQIYSAEFDQKHTLNKTKPALIYVKNRLVQLKLKMPQDGNVVNLLNETKRLIAKREEQYQNIVQTMIVVNKYHNVLNKFIDFVEPLKRLFFFEMLPFSMYN